MNPSENVAPAIEQGRESTQSDDESVQELVVQVSHLVTQFDQLIPLLESAQEQESAISYIALVPSEDGSESTAVLIPAEAGDLDQEKLFKSIGKAISKVNWGKVANVVGGAVKGGLGGIAGGIPGIVAGAAMGGIGAATQRSVSGPAGGLPGAVANVAVQGIARLGAQRAQRRAARAAALPAPPPAPPAVQTRPPVPQRQAPQPRLAVRQRRTPANIAGTLRQAQQLYAAVRQQAPVQPAPAPVNPQPAWDPAQDPAAMQQPAWDPAQDPAAMQQPAWDPAQAPAAMQQPAWDPAQAPAAMQQQPAWDPAQDPAAMQQPAWDPAQDPAAMQQPAWDPAQAPAAPPQGDPAWLEHAAEGEAPGSAADIAQLARQLVPYLTEMLRGPGQAGEAAPVEATHAEHCPACAGREAAHVHASGAEHVQVESSAALPVGEADDEWLVTSAEDDEDFTVADLVTELQRAQETLLELFPAAELTPAEDLVDSLSTSTFLEWERN